MAAIQQEKFKLFNIIFSFLGHSIYKCFFQIIMLEFSYSKNVRSVFFEFHLFRP